MGLHGVAIGAPHSQLEVDCKQGPFSGPCSDGNFLALPNCHPPAFAHPQRGIGQEPGGRILSGKSNYRCCGEESWRMWPDITSDTWKGGLSYTTIVISTLGNTSP
ncbi:uncharacterized protein LOC142789931 [Rhipicephalus microplus]|uniref:uncharacterized protein LOC142789931 n=1 Tax=Rhipicephalus microplus TaxID=6941 RepID=UPI003F6B531A